MLITAPIVDDSLPGGSNADAPLWSLDLVSLFGLSWARDIAVKKPYSFPLKNFFLYVLRPLENDCC